MSATRVAVVGTGAIGGLLAAELHAAGADVVLCARTPFERLVVERSADARDIAVGKRLALVTGPADAAEAAWVLVTLKGQDTSAAGPWLERLVGAGTQGVVVVQNGIEHRERLGDMAGDAPVVPAIIRAAVERVAPGHLLHRAAQEVTLEASDAGRRFAELLGPTVLDVVLTPDFHTEAWRKLLSNAAANPITALTDGRMEVFAEPGVSELVRALLEEAEAIARADGAQLVVDAVDRMMAYYAAMPPDSGTSMFYDRRDGRPLEVDALTGAVVRAAGRTGKPAPLHTAMRALLTGLDASLRAS